MKLESIFWVKSCRPMVIGREIFHDILQFTLVYSIVQNKLFLSCPLGHWGEGMGMYWYFVWEDRYRWLRENTHIHTLSTITIPLPKSPPPPLLRDWTAHNPSFGTCFILLMILGSQSGICDEGFHLTKCRKTSRASRGS